MKTDLLEPEPDRGPGRPPHDAHWRGEGLRLRRLLKGLTCAQLARKVKVSKSTVVRWERNVNTPAPDDLARLCAFFKVHPDDFARDPEIH
jgi:transcriptional regulator with XRE-family HTH domain